jgi:hypothetical protein
MRSLQVNAIMKSRILQLAAHALALSAMSASAAIRYVNMNSASPRSPFTNWTTAATTIQAAVDTAVAGDQILVTNGVYQTGGRAVFGVMNRVTVDKPVKVQSVNGAVVTVIQGSQVPGTVNGDGAVRCVYLGGGAALAGFTLTNGATRISGDNEDEQRGGGVWCESASAVVSNCVLTANSAYLGGGGASGGTLFNCTFIGNSAPTEFQGHSVNSAGGGASGSKLFNCTLTSNSAFFGGGTAGGTLNNCTLAGNSSALGGGGASGGTLNNCTLTGNLAYYGGGAGDAALNNCTLTRNLSRGGCGSGAFGGTLNNCIVYDDLTCESALNYCCTTALPSGGQGNFTNAPLFLNQAGGDLRLQSNSPCINAGSRRPVRIWTATHASSAARWTWVLMSSNRHSRSSPTPGCSNTVCPPMVRRMTPTRTVTE